jgi:hypothetical protein
LLPSYATQPLDDVASHPTTCARCRLELEPKGEAEIAARWKEQDRSAAVQAAVEQREHAVAEEQRKLDIEEDQHRADLAAGIAPNPDLSVGGRARFDFTVNKRLPRGVTHFGFVRHVRQQDGSRALLLDQKSYLLIDLKMFTPNGGGVERLNQYTLVMNFKLTSYPSRLQTLYRTSPPTSKVFSHEVTIDREVCGVRTLLRLSLSSFLVRLRARACPFACMSAYLCVCTRFPGLLCQPLSIHSLSLGRLVVRACAQGSVGVDEGNNNPFFGRIGAQKWLWVAIVYVLALSFLASACRLCFLVLAVLATKCTHRITYFVRNRPQPTNHNQPTS